jgi:glutamate/tyrosine decarboxylase-like PLP-dependent enzyme
VPAEVSERLVATPLPEHGVSADEILRRFTETVAPFPFGNGHPRFYGWVNSPPATVAVLIDVLAAAMNPSVAGGNHAAVWIEREVLEWFKQLTGFPKDGMGLLVSGGSAAALTALAVARHVACAKRHWNVRADGLQQRAAGETGVPSRRLVLYKGGEGHGCHQKAAELLGMGSANVRVVPSDSGLRIRPDALDDMIRADLAAGHIPVAVVATVGTVNTGAIDPIADIAEVCGRHGVWLHVDAAYGGPAILSNEYAEPIAAIARADSVALDPHKWMYVPVDAGLVLVRDAGAMRNAFSLVAPYLRTDGNLHGVQGPTWFSEYGAEQTRPFRALKVWAALQFFGRDGYRRLIEHDLALARHLAARVGEAPELALWQPTNLSIVCFRATATDRLRSPDDIDALNRRILERVQLSGEAFLSGTTLDGRFWLRACIVNPRASAADVDAVFEAVRKARREVLDS